MGATKKVFGGHNILPLEQFLRGIPNVKKKRNRFYSKNETLKKKVKFECETMPLLLFPEKWAWCPLSFLVISPSSMFLKTQEASKSGGRKAFFADAAT